MMKLLVMGGSYFYGRVFTMLASKEYELTLFNRGTYSMQEYGVRQIVGDRHDPAVLKQLKESGCRFDAVVDFCAYEPGDIRMVTEHLPCKPKQYLLISTVDVCRRGLKGLKTEEAPYEIRKIPGEAGAYIAGKVSLEQELKELCEGQEIAYTILRPAILYGPYNYAPRESCYIQMAVQNHLLPEITDAKGEFQFVYVKDAAEAILECLFHEKAYGQSYTICADEILNYELLLNGIAQAASKDGASGQMVKRIPLTAEQAQNQGIPLPFPIYAEETELYTNEKSKRELGLTYTSFEDGIAKTYQAFKGVFG